LVITYTATGGIKALTWADVQQMTMIFIALIASFIVVVYALPSAVSFRDALHLAGAAGRLNAVDLRLDFSDRFNIWSGLIGGGFLALAYFGCDQSQVQRYLTGKSIAQSRLSLIFTSIVKIPMQVFILFIGAMVFVLSLFVPSPAIFQPVEAVRVAKSSSWKPIEATYERAFEQRREAAYDLTSAIRNRGPETNRALSRFREAQNAFTRTRQQALQMVELEHGG